MPKSERNSVVRVPDFKVNGLPSHGPIPSFLASVEPH